MHVAVWSSCVVLVVAAFAAGVGACNAITDTGKYYLVDEAGASDAQGGADGGGAEGPLPNPACASSGPAPIPKCSEGALGQSIHTAPEDPRVIGIPTDDKEAPFDPNCMIIKAGQKVTWRGNLSFHPLIQREDSTLPNPISTVQSGTETSVLFACQGDFNFSCRNHRDSMLGTIRVVP